MSNRQVNFSREPPGIDSIGHPFEPPPPYSVTDTETEATIVNQPVIHQTVVIEQSLKDEPIYYNCPSCHKRILTTVQFVNSHKTHMFAGFICGLTFWCMLCCLAAIPYMVTTLKTADHYCSNCNYYLGSYSRV